MNTFINGVSAGEISKGMLIMGYETLEKKPRGFSFNFGEDDDMDKVIINPFPWFKGYSWEVIEVAGPIVVARPPTNGVLKNGFKLNTMYVFDTRTDHFMEVSKEYHENFWKAAMGVV